MRPCCDLQPSLWVFGAFSRGCVGLACSPGGTPGVCLVQKALVMGNVPQLSALIPDSLLKPFPASSLAFSSRFQHTERTFIYQHSSNNLSLKKWHQSIKCTTGNPQSHVFRNIQSKLTSDNIPHPWHLAGAGLWLVSFSFLLDPMLRKGTYFCSLKIFFFNKQVIGKQLWMAASLHEDF